MAIEKKAVLRKLIPVAGFLAVVALMALAMFGFMLPPDWIVIRDVTVDAPAERVFPVFADFKRWPQWSPWQKQDKAMQVAVSARSRGKGAVQTWESPGQGTGKIEVTEFARNSEITCHLAMKGSWESEFDFRIESVRRQDGKTDLRWVAFGREEKLLAKLMAQLLFDRFMGPDLEAGLAAIKQIAEGGGDGMVEELSEPAPPKPRPAAALKAPAPAPAAAPTPTPSPAPEPTVAPAAAPSGGAR